MSIKSVYVPFDTSSNVENKDAVDALLSLPDVLGENYSRHRVEFKNPPPGVYYGVTVAKFKEETTISGKPAVVEGYVYTLEDTRPNEH